MAWRTAPASPLKKPITSWLKEVPLAGLANTLKQLLLAYNTDKQQEISREMSV